MANKPTHSHCGVCGAAYPSGRRCPFCTRNVRRSGYDAAGIVAACALGIALCVVLAGIVQGQGRPIVLLTTCLAGEAGIKPVADHGAILHVLHRLARKRGQSVDTVTRAHCNASVSEKGIARVHADMVRYPQDWQALVQFVEAFDADTPNPCRGATTWGSPHIGSDVAHAKRLGLVEVVCTAPTLNRFLKAGRP